jgi:hypothetical protein
MKLFWILVLAIIFSFEQANPNENEIISINKKGTYSGVAPLGGYYKNKVECFPVPGLPGYGISKPVNSTNHIILSDAIYMEF